MVDADKSSFGKPKLLLSATHWHLVTLPLWNMPHSGYISPETMMVVHCPFCIDKGSKNSHFHSDRLYLARTPTRSVIPALAQLCVNPGCYIL
jgi:hypothetical protein